MSSRLFTIEQMAVEQRQDALREARHDALANRALRSQAEGPSDLVASALLALVMVLIVLALA